MTDKQAHNEFTAPLGRPYLKLDRGPGGSKAANNALRAMKDVLALVEVRAKRTTLQLDTNAQSAQKEIGAKKLASLIQQLGAEEFADREKAAKLLTEIGPVILPQLHKALDHRVTEISDRASKIVKTLWGKSSPETPPWLLNDQERFWKLYTATDHIHYRNDDKLTPDLEKRWQAYIKAMDDERKKIGPKELAARIDYWRSALKNAEAKGKRGQELFPLYKQLNALEFPERYPAIARVEYAYALRTNGRDKDAMSNLIDAIKAYPGIVNNFHFEREAASLRALENKEFLELFQKSAGDKAKLSDLTKALPKK